MDEMITLPDYDNEDWVCLRGLTSEQFRGNQAYARLAVRQATTELRSQLYALREERDNLRQALEIIAVGDAENPQAQAAEELIALGYWRDIPEARNYNNATKESKNETR